MGMDVAFWRYNAPGSHDHIDTYGNLAEGAAVESLATLPVEEIKAALSEQLEIEWEEPRDAGIGTGSTGGSLSGANSGFEIHLGDQALVLSCYGDFGGDLAKFGAVMERFKCPVFVAPTGERFGNEFD